MKIAIASEKDVPVLAILNKRLIEDEHYPNPMNVNELEERMKNWLHNEYTAYTIKENHDMLGYCLFRDDGDFYYMRHLYIDRPHRRKGLATKLLDWMYAHIWTDKNTRVDVLSDNYRAIEFYTSYGFKIRCLHLEK
ncbi:MAG: GNAT family N-acetyltransferase [bacterium]|nr:GNAT family N-acetyltransferase [bacterium]